MNGLFGRVVIKIDNVFVVKKFSQNMGYQGLALKNKLMQLNKHTVMDWAVSKLAPGTANDIMTKDAVVDCFKVHYHAVLSEWDQQRFLSAFPVFYVTMKFLLYIYIFFSHL